MPRPVLVWLSLWSSATHAAGLCLHDGVPESERRSRGPHNIYRNITIGYADSYWTSHELVAQIQAIIVREKLGIHVDEVVSDAIDTATMYFAVAGCHDAFEFTCNDIQPNKRLIDWSPEYWPSEESHHAGIVNTAAGESLYAEDRVIQVGSLGYVAQGAICIMSEVVKRAWTQDALSLDWFRTLSSDRALSYFTPLSQIDVSWGIYQFCDHTEAEFLERRGYLCNSDFEYDNPWRRPVDGSWSELGDWPRTLYPIANCSEMSAEYPLVTEAFQRHGFACRGEGWWLSRACAERSPGEEFRDLCLPVLSYDVTAPIADLAGLGKIPVAASVISQWDALEELFYDWSEGYQLRGGHRNVALFEYWLPDASLTINYLVSEPIKYHRLKFHMELESDVEVVTTLAHMDAFSFAPEVVAFLKRFRMKSSSMMDLMESLVNISTRSASLEEAKTEAACGWVKDNILLLDTWIGNRSCLANTFYDASRRMCLQCPRGFASKAHSIGLTSCQPCAHGHVYTDGICKECPVGFYMRKRGDAKCTACPRGEYQPHEGSRGCLTCPNTFTTFFDGAESIFDCACPEGHFYDPEVMLCVACYSRSTKGLRCPGGFRFPLNVSSLSQRDETPMVQAGYMSLPSEPLLTYTCKHCLEETSPFEAGGCPKNFQTVAQCFRCSGGFRLEAFGRCSWCYGEPLYTRVFKTMGFGIGSILVTFRLYTKCNMPTPPGLVTISQLIVFLQALQTVQGIPLGWPPIVTAWAGVVTKISLSYVVKLMSPRSECHVGSSVSLDVLKDAMGPSIPCAALAVIAVGIRSIRGSWPPADYIINFFGIIFTRLFISVSRLALTLFVSNKMPNGKNMIMAIPDVEFGSSVWVKLLPLYIAMFAVYSLGTFAIVVRAIILAPVQASKDPRFLIRYRFLFGSFRPDRYWWMIVSLIHGLCLNLCPVGIGLRDQVFLTMAAQAGMLSLVARFSPYKFRACTMTDIALKQAILVYLVVSLAFIDTSEDTDETRDYYATFSAIVMCIAVLYAMKEIASWAFSMTRSPGFRTGSLAQDVWFFRDVAAKQTELTNVEFFRGIERMNDTDVHKLREAANVLIGTMFEKQVCDKRWQQRLIPQAPLQVWDRSNAAREVMAHAADPSGWVVHEQNQNSRQQLLSLAQQLSKVKRLSLSDPASAPRVDFRTVMSKGLRFSLIEHLGQKIIRHRRPDGKRAKTWHEYFSQAMSWSPHDIKTRVTFDEFVENLNHLFEHAVEEQDVRAAFDSFDVHRQGSVSLPEFVAVMMSMIPGVPSEDVETVSDAADTLEPAIDEEANTDAGAINDDGADVEI